MTARRPWYCPPRSSDLAQLEWPADGDRHDQWRENGDAAVRHLGRRRPVSELQEAGWWLEGQCGLSSQVLIVYVGYRAPGRVTITSGN